MKKRIGILTSGGDYPGLNATIRGVAKACFELMGEENVEIIGISNGYYGLIHNLCKPKNTGVGSLSFLQRIFLTQESNWGLLHYR